MIVAHGFCHGWRHQAVQGQTGPHSGADLRGGNPQRKTGQAPLPEGRLQLRCRFSWPGNDHELHQLSQLFRRTPLGQLRRMVSADEVEELRVGPSARILLDGIDGEGGSSSPEFLFVDLVMAFSRQSQPQQPEPFRGWRRCAIGLEGRLRGWDEEETRQPEFLARRLRHQQVTAMHGIEGAAK